MPTTTLHFAKAGVEDLEIGIGTFTAKTSDGREITLNKINLSSFIAPTAIDKAIYFTNGSLIGQDSSFTYDTDTGDMIISGGQLMVGGSATPDKTLHVAESGAVAVRIENDSLTTGTVALEYAINGSVDWNLSCVDSDSDNLVLSSGSSASTTPHLTFHRSNNQVAIGTRTASTFTDYGLVVDQGIDTGHVLEFYGTGSVSHGMTDFADAGCYGYVRQLSGSGDGGIVLVGVSEGIRGCGLIGLATSEGTTTSDATLGCITLTAFLKSGTSAGALGATGNVVTIANDTTTIVVIKGDGDVHNSGGDTAMGTYDNYDDIKLLQAVKGAMDVSYQKSLGAWIHEHTEILQRGGVISRDEGNQWFISQRGWRGLVVDAMRQLSARIDALETN